MLHIMKQMKVYRFVVPVVITIDEAHFIKHVSSKLLPHAIRVTIIVVIIKECIQ